LRSWRKSERCFSDLKSGDTTDGRNEEIDAFVTFLYAQSVVTEGTRTVNVARDPQDNKFLACASEGSAEYLVSGDDDLLQIKVFERTQIVRPRAFLETLQSS